jgi:hypothetical protein
MLLPNKTVVVDCGYCGNFKVRNSDMGSDNQKKAMSKACACHETANMQMKNWDALKERSQHSINKHHLVFRTVIMIKQIKIQHGKPLFQIEEVPEPLVAW